MPAHQDAAQQIVIIGGGLSGATLAIKLLQKARHALTIRLVDPAAQLGRGLAYATVEPGHLLNGPAGIFSLFPDLPNHFIDWLAAQPEYAGQTIDGLAQTFVPRWRYGDYVNQTLQQAQREAPAGVRFEHVRARVDDLELTPRGLQLTLDTHHELRADHVVLALGVFQARPRFDADGSLTRAGTYVPDPWDRPRLAALAQAKDIVLAGASLTMIDAVVALENQGYGGRYRVLTRHGLTPVARRNIAPATDLFGHDGPPTDLRGMVRTLRQAALARGGDWQALPPALRSYIADWWRGTTHVERRRFFRHLRPYWDVFLHRAPPVSAALVESLRASGRLTVEAAIVQGLSTAPDGRVGVHYRPRGSDHAQILHTHAVVNCTGPDYRWHAGSEHRLVRHLFARRLVQTGPAEFGIAADPSLAAIDAEGIVSPRLSVLGAALRGTLLEPGTITDITYQTSALSTRLLSATQPQTVVADTAQSTPGDTQRDAGSAGLSHAPSSTPHHATASATAPVAASGQS